MTSGETQIARYGLVAVVLLLLTGVILNATALRRHPVLRTWNNFALMALGGLAAVMLTAIDVLLFM